MRLVGLLLSGCLFLVSQQVNAAILNIGLQVSITGSYGAAAKPYQPAYQMNVRFDPGAGSIYDAGVSTYSFYIVGAPDVITSAITPLVSAGVMSGLPYQSVQGRVDDYPGVFLKKLSFSENRYYEQGGILGQSVLEVLFLESSSGRAGNGSSDYPLSQSDISNALRIGNTAQLVLFGRLYDAQGTRWGYDGYVTVMSVTSEVPEPASWLLMISGFTLIAASLRGRTGGLRRLSYLNR